MEGLKDDNNKLQRLIRENAKQSGLVKELKTANEQLRASERRLREELVQAGDRARAVKAEALRKDTLAKELREKLEAVQDDGSALRERDCEIDRLRELLKKHRLEVEIKENQVRTLKVKLEHLEGEQAKTEQVRGSQRQEAEDEARTLRTKLKRSEAQLKRALEALRKISRELGSKRPSACPTTAKPQI